MRKLTFLCLLLLLLGILSGCASENDIPVVEITGDTTGQLTSEDFNVNDNVEQSKQKKGEDIMATNKYDFNQFSNVNVTGINIDDLNEQEQSVLFQAARYCQAMTDADIETMKKIVSKDMIFTHMSGKQQTREEYFADVKKEKLTYYTIGIKNPKISLNGGSAVITYTSVLNANAYGARGTFHMTGSHYYENVDGEWIQKNQPE